MYVNENAYVAWVRGGDILKIVVSDLKLMSVFYTLEQHEVPLLHFQRADAPSAYSVTPIAEQTGPRDRGSEPVDRF